MAKALKIFVILLFLLSIASLVLGIMLFGQREILKGRTLALEKATQSFAEKLRYEDLDIAKVRVYEQMRAPLQLLAVHADNTYLELQDTKQDLENTRQELALTKEELEATKVELADARNEIANLQTTLAQVRGELDVANNRIRDLEEEKQGLLAEVEGLKDELVKTEEQVEDLQAEVESLEKIIAKFDARDGVTPSVPEGLAGQILVVNPGWNFVVVDIGSEAGLVPNAEMMVHRADQLVGKVRVTAVEDYMAVADMIGEWEQAPIREGDKVLYVVF